jgi:hypothetical protein
VTASATGIRAGYVYVASSWRNALQPVLVNILRQAEIDCYDFRNPEGGTGFHWSEVGVDSAGETPEDYLAGLDRPRSIAGFEADFAAMQKADTFVLVLPCGRSAHLELGWAVGAGKRTAIFLGEQPVIPELMYRMADLITPSTVELLAWLGVEN